MILQILKYAHIHYRYVEMYYKIFCLELIPLNKVFLNISTYLKMKNMKLNPI